VADREVVVGANVDPVGWNAVTVAAGREARIYLIKYHYLVYLSSRSTISNIHDVFIRNE
jgi:hypothetical protein